MVQVLDVLAAIAVPVEIKFLWRPQLRDAADEMVLETAVNGMANATVTDNGRDLRIAPARFGIEILTPAKVIGERR